MFFYSIGDVLAFLQLSSILVCLFGMIILKESSGINEIAATVISLIGCILIIKPPFLFDGNSLSYDDVLFLLL